MLTQVTYTLQLNTVVTPAEQMLHLILYTQISAIYGSDECILEPNSLLKASSSDNYIKPMNVCIEQNWKTSSESSATNQPGSSSNAKDLKLHNYTNCNI